MFKQNIIFDLDDTLIHCNKYFHAVIDAFSEKVSEWFSNDSLSIEEVKKKQEEIDILGVTHHGFAAEHFKDSLIKTYVYFSEKFGREINEEDQLWIRALGKSAYEQNFEPYPFMLDILQALEKADHNLYLYTGGNSETQKKKIDIVGVEPFFKDRIYITPHKNADVLESIIEKEKLNKKDTWMIGNSMKSDIMPAIKAGINAVFIPGIYHWEYDNVKLQDEHKEAFITVNSLEELKGLFLQEEAV